MKEVKDLEVAQSNYFSGNSTNTKDLYIVEVYEPTTKSVIVYLAVRADETNAAVKMSGYDTSRNKRIIEQLKNAKTYNEALDLAKSKDLEFQVLTFPWSRIVRIKQLKFTLAK